MASERCYEWKDNDLILNLKISAGASGDEITGDTIASTKGSGHSWLRVKVAAPPTDGKANKRLCKLLAERFGVSRSRVQIASGESRAYKRVRIIAPEKLPDFISS